MKGYLLINFSLFLSFLGKAQIGTTLSDDIANTNRNAYVSTFLTSQGKKKNTDLYKLWTGGEIGKSEDIPLLKHVKFKTIKEYEPKVDGYKFLLGVAMVRYHDQWIVSFGHNKGLENTSTEVANSIFSNNGSKWGDLVTIDSAKNQMGVSHGVFLNYEDKLWAFHGSFLNKLELVHTNAYNYNQRIGKWEYRGIVAADGFWPLQEPIKMDNGEWIMAGASIIVGPRQAQPAVAISKNDKFNQWEVRRIPSAIKVWGESTIIVDGAKVLLISRSHNNTPKIEGMSHPLAYVSLSTDYGKTWSELKPSNLPMSASKPYAGILSNGQRYLINSISEDTGNNRAPLTIAVSRPNENSFVKLYRICDVEKGQKRNHTRFSYPYAVEYEGNLWIVYSKSADRSEPNNNSAELAIVPIKELKVK